MPSEVQSSSPTPVQAINQQAGGVQAFKDVFGHLKTFSSDASFEKVFAVFDEITHLQRQLESRDEELARLKEEIKDKDKKKEIAINEMFGANQKEKSKHDEILGRVRSLETSVQEKEAALAEQNRTADSLTNQLESLKSSYAEEKAKVTQAHDDIDTLQQNLKDKDATIDKMKAAGSELKQILSTTKKKVKDLEETKTSLEESLHTNVARLSELEGFAVGYEEGEEDSLLDNFDDLWDYATKQIYSHLKENLPSEALQNHQAWDTLRLSDQALRHHVPLPRSNSKAAKQMRLALILAILAREIDRHIFQPTYILPEDSKIREVLVNLAMKDSKKESFCRSILLSIDPDTQAKSLEARRQAVVRNVGSHIFGLLSETQYDETRHSLERIVQKAADTWKRIQRTKQRYEPDFEPLQWGDPDWKPFIPPDDGPAEDQRVDGAIAIDENLLTVFPRLCQVENNGRLPCTYVIEVRRSLRQCVAAERELIREPPSPTIGRVTSNRSRRKSITTASGANHNGNFLGKTSPSVA